MKKKTQNVVFNIVRYNFNREFLRVTIYKAYSSLFCNITNSKLFLSDFIQEHNTSTPG